MGQNYVPKIYKRPPAVSLKNFDILAFHFPKEFENAKLIKFLTFEFYLIAESEPTGHELDLNWILNEPK